MKILFVLNLFLILTGLTSYSQQNGEFEFGTGLGLNLANVLRVDGLRNTSSSRIALNTAISAEYYFTDIWGFKTKLIYDAKGWSDGFLIRTDENNNDVTTDIKLNYLTIPVMANWHFGYDRNWNLNFGPYVGFLINAKDSELGLDLKNGLNNMDLGLAFGIGHKFKINDDLKLYIEYDGQIGIINIFEDDSGINLRNIRSGFNVGVLVDF